MIIDTNSILATRNEGWGFYGTMGGQADELWPIAFAAVAQATGQSPESVRAFLDSRHGRHFADEVLDALNAGRPPSEAVELTVERWMAWRVSSRTQNSHGVPRGLSYLTSWVIHMSLLEETA